jgi:hypothetical protein
MRRAFNKLMVSFAAFQGVSEDAANAILTLYGNMKKASIPPDTRTLELLLFACTKVGQSSRAIEYVREFDSLGGDSARVQRLSSRGATQLLTILSRVSSESAWNACEPILSRSLKNGSGAEFRHDDSSTESVLGSAVEIAVLAFARRGNAEICERIVALTGIEPREWRMALSGRDFQRVRALQGYSRYGARNTHARRDGSSETSDPGRTRPKLSSAPRVRQKFELQSECDDAR